MQSTIRAILGLTAVLAVTCPLFAGRAEADKDHCLDANTEKDLVLSEACPVPIGTTKSYRHIHILSNGILDFQDGAGETTIWARAILVEDGGTLRAGTAAKPFGTDKGRLTIYLYGETQGKNGSGVACKSQPVETCGAPPGIFFSNVDATTHTVKPTQLKVEQLGSATPPVPPAVIATYQGPKNDYFYAYHTLTHDEGDHQAYFGYKVLGVSYGGTLQLFGKKGAIYDDIAADKSCNPTGPNSAKSTGRSWVRLAKTANTGESTIYVETPPCGLDWTDKDDIVLTTTDYLPGHSEHLTISGAPAVVKATDPEAVTDPALAGTTKIVFTPALLHIHNGKRFPLDNTTHPGISRVGLHPDLANGAETRAVAALLSRSIRIYSAGTKTGEFLPKETDAACTDEAGPETNTCYFGGHTIFRQGFKAVQVQGVEFYQMGQGGRIGHYPVHFHHARKTQDATNSRPATFVMDSSIWDSMTRWIVLHGTQDVTLARNVGYKSIGHGYYLEDATEINNKLLANVGIFARAAVANVQNPRKVPGILAAPEFQNAAGGEVPPYRADYDHPSVFWITNAHNDFQYNMAAGAGTCGVCYWFPNAAISTSSREQKWESYAAMQSSRARAGMAPLKSFIGNSCTSAMTALQTITITQGCKGLAPVAPGEGLAGLAPISNSLAPASPNDAYYPALNDGGLFPTLCPAGRDCGSDNFQTGAPRCGENNDLCAPTVIDQFTTSFNWAGFNFAAVWLRPQWYLVSNSVITDVQQAGLTMVTGGGYDASSVIPGHWAVVRKSVFIGNTQDCPSCDVKVNPYASNGGPFNPTGLKCAQFTQGARAGKRPGEFCLSVAEGVSYQLENFGMYQRLFSVYDGPAFQDSNAYLNIKTRTLDDCKPGVDPDDPGHHFCKPTNAAHKQSEWLAGNVLALPKGYPDPLNPVEAQAFCYLPNAAIGWKQPNGFYYPPAFHSRNLFFKDVDIRHFVVTPLFKEGTLITDPAQVEKLYCDWNNGLFNGFTSNDRQTVLNDDDGSLTGYRGRHPGQSPEFRPSTVVNLDPFFNVPVSTIQCQSDNSSRTSPYDYVTTVVYPKCVIDGTCAPDIPDDVNNPHTGDWDRSCSNETCYGIPLVRLDRMPNHDGANERSIRMAGQKIAQRSTLTVNHGTYYMDTTVGRELQLKGQRRGHPEDPPCARPNNLQDGCRINVFKANATYYLFQIFAKQDTQQIYRFYVGPTSAGTEPDAAKFLQVQMAQAEIKRTPIQFSNIRDYPVGIVGQRVKWFNNDKLTGIVEIDLRPADFIGNGNQTFAQLSEAARVAKCKPSSYCSYKSGQCVDASGSTDVCGWAVADLDCPEGGCFGIKFTLPGTFATDPATDPLTHLRPFACLANTSPWDVTLADPAQAGSFTPQQVAGSCFHFPPEPNDFCP